MTFKRSILALACAQALLQLGGCGGGDTSHAEADAYIDGNNNRDAGNEEYGRGVQGQPGALKVSAGKGQQADSGVQVLLQGNAAGGTDSQYSYQWSQIGGELSVSLANANQAAANFVAPKVTHPSNLKFRLTVTNAAGEVASDTVSVVVSDLKPFARISSSGVNESAGNVQLVVTLSEVPSKTVLLNYLTFDLSAKAGSDFKAASGQISFAPGQTQARISIELIDDAVLESSESFAVKLSAPKNGGIAIDTGIVTILDNDQLTGRALLGPVVGATVTISDFFTQQTLCTLSIPESTDLTTAGTFVVPRGCLQNANAKLVTVSGGADIDVNDDGVLDQVATPLARSFHAVLPASYTGKTRFTVSALTEAAYLRSTLNEFADNAALEADLNRSAKALVSASLDGDSSINANDLLFWNPRQDAAKFKKSGELLNLTTQSILNGFDGEVLTQHVLAQRLMNDPLGQVSYSAYGTYEAGHTPVVGGKASYLFSGEGQYYFQFDVSKPNDLRALESKSLPTSDYRADIYAADDFIIAAYGNLVDVIGSTTTLPSLNMGKYYQGFDLGNKGVVAMSTFDNTHYSLETNNLSTAGLSTAQFGSVQLDLVPQVNCPILVASGGVGSGFTVESGISLVKVINDHAAVFYYQCLPFTPNPGYMDSKTGMYWIDISNPAAPKLEKTIPFNALTRHVRDVAQNANDLYVVADQQVVRLNLDSGKQAATVLSDTSFDADGRYVPIEVEAAENTLYTLFDDQFTSAGSASFVVKSDISNTSAISQTGRIILQDSNYCTTHPFYYPNYSNPNDNLALSLHNGILFVGLYYATTSDTYYARDPGMLSFDAVDLKGDNSFTSPTGFYTDCSANNAL